MRRRLVACGGDIAKLAEDRTRTLPEVVDECQRLVMDTDAERSEGPAHIMADFGPWLDDLDARFQSGGGSRGAPTGFTDLDRLTGGLMPGDLVVLAARPSHGKTTLALNIATAFLERGDAVLFFSLEMTRSAIRERLIAARGGLDMTRLRDADLSDDDWTRVRKAGSWLQDAPLDVDDGSSLSVLEVRSRARRIARKRDLKLVIVDYLQMMRGSGRSENRTQEVRQISNGLKALAKELGVPVLALSQLNRKVEERGNKRPLPSDLRESGDLEQDADLLMFLYRHELYEPHIAAAQGMAELLIRKQRNGATGDLYLAADMARCVFRDCDREAAEDYRRAVINPPVLSRRRSFDYESGQDRATSSAA